MKYRLKDRELEAKLNSLSKEYPFSNELQNAIKNHNKGDVIDVNFGLGVLSDEEVFPTAKFMVRLYENEIESYEEYDPNKWNKYPDITPPENIPMRLEYLSFGQIKKECCIYRHSKWLISNTLEALPNGAKNIRYKAWDLCE